MNIRQANKFDMPYFINLIHRINDDDSLGDIYVAELDDKYLNSLFMTMISGGGICYIAESEEKIGMIAGMFSPVLWHPKDLWLHQVLYFVEEEYRYTRAGYLLFKEFDKQSEQFIKDKRVMGVTLSAPKPIIDMDFERFDYELTEKTWSKKGFRVTA